MLVFSREGFYYHDGHFTSPRVAWLSNTSIPHKRTFQATDNRRLANVWTTINASRIDIFHTSDKLLGFELTTPGLTAGVAIELPG